MRGRLIAPLVGALVVGIAFTGSAAAATRVVELQPEVACSISNYADADSCDGAGGWPVTDVFEGFHGGDYFSYRTLLRFDVRGAVPVGATVRSATLNGRYDPQHPAAGEAASVAAYRLTSAWGRPPSWYERRSGRSWSWPNGGGDIVQPAYPAAAPAPGLLAWDVAGLVDRWRAAGDPNFGLALTGTFGAEGPLRLTAPALRIEYSIDGPELTVAGDLRSRPIEPGPRSTYPLAITARHPTQSMRDVRILIDGQEEERFEPGPDCSAPCPVSVDDFAFSLDWVAEGQHEVEVAATTVAGTTLRDRWTISVPGEDRYAQELAAWRAEVEQYLDNPANGPLANPMPAIPDDWRTPAACEASEDDVRACYDAVTQWGADMRNWLRAELAQASWASTIRRPPIFDYSARDDIAEDLTRRLRDAFVIAAHEVADPQGTIDVAIGFHRPLTPAQLRAAIPSHAQLQPQSALTGAYDPLEGEWGGSARVTNPSSLDDSIEGFYLNQIATVERSITEFENEQPADAEEAEDIQTVLEQARGFRAHLLARGAFITGVTVRLGPAQAVAALTSSPTLIKSVAPLPAGGSLATDGNAALGGMSIDAIASDSPGFTGLRGHTSSLEADPRYPTCDDRGETGRIPRSLLQPNPVYFAPSRHKADTEFTDPDGGHHLKEHRLRFRWQAEFGLAWVCAARSGNRNIEIEAMVYPNDDERWSDNWESNDATTYTQSNMPGNLHQDDLASGQGFPFVDKAKYPDFAILAQSSRRFRYRKLYWVNFTTNEGETDTGRVIYSVQPTHRAATEDQEDYCGRRQEDYKSCMFSTVDVCYGHRTISQGSVHTRIDWAASLGYLSRLSSVRRAHPDIVQGREVTKLCDPRPPGSNDG